MSLLHVVPSLLFGKLNYFHVSAACPSFHSGVVSRRRWAYYCWNYLFSSNECVLSRNGLFELNEKCSYCSNNTDYLPFNLFLQKHHNQHESFSSKQWNVNASNRLLAPFSIILSTLYPQLREKIDCYQIMKARGVNAPFPWFDSHSYGFKSLRIAINLIFKLTVQLSSFIHRHRRCVNAHTLRMWIVISFQVVSTRYTYTQHQLYQFFRIESCVCLLDAHCN